MVQQPQFSAGDMNALVLVLCVFTTCILAQSKDKFTDKYDHFDLDEILRNDRLLDGYFKCIKDNFGCSAEGKELRKSVPEALKDDCAKCTARQKAGADKVIRFLYKNKPEYWKQLEKIFDPDETYRKKYEERYEQIKKEAEST